MKDHANASAKPLRRIVLEPGRAERNYWADLWHRRELFLILTWRDIAVRYKQTVLGMLWAVIRPLLIVLVLTGIFGGVAGLPSPGDTPYAVMVLAGMIPWMLVSTILSEASRSLVDNASLVEKVHLPRLLIPTSVAGAALVDFAITTVLLFGVMVLFGVLPGWRVVFLPAVTAMALLVALGPAYLLSALTVRYHDFRHVVPFVVQFGLYLSPVGFSSAVIPPEWRLLYGLNPVVGVIDAFRWCLLGEASGIHLPGMVLGLLVTAALLAIGIGYFRRAEKTFADVI